MSSEQTMYVDLWLGSCRLEFQISPENLQQEYETTNTAERRNNHRHTQDVIFH